MGNSSKLSCPGSVVTWVACLQNQMSLFSYSLSPSSSLTLKKFPTRPRHMRKNNHCLGQKKKWKLHHSSKNNSRKEKRKERGGSDWDKNRVRTCNLKKWEHSVTRGLVELNELKTKVKGTVWSHYPGLQLGQLCTKKTVCSRVHISISYLFSHLFPAQSHVLSW